MAKVAGRKVRIYVGTDPVMSNNTLVAGSRSDSISINNSAIDVTDKGSDGWRTMLGDAAVRSVDMTVAGFLDGNSLLAKAFGSSTALVEGYSIDIEGIGVASGNFHFSSIEITANHDSAAEFSASIASDGVIAWANAT